MLETTFEEKMEAAVVDLNAILEKGLPESLPHVRKAIEALMTAEQELCEAANKVKGTPEDDRLVSLSMGVEDIECEVRKQEERMKKL